MIRSIYTLNHDEIVQMAREQAESGDPCSHGYELGSTQAITFENHYLARNVELEEFEA